VAWGGGEVLGLVNIMTKFKVGNCLGFVSLGNNLLYGLVLVFACRFVETEDRSANS
jgi:hypothetical protein